MFTCESFPVNTQQTLLVAGSGPLYAGEPKVSVPAAESGALPVFELAAGAQPLHLQPVQEEGQAEGETSVSPRNEPESICGGGGARRKTG